MHAENKLRRRHGASAKRASEDNNANDKQRMDAAAAAMQAYLRTHDLRGAGHRAAVAAIVEQAPNPLAFLAAHFSHHSQPRADTGTAHITAHGMDADAVRAYLSSHDLVAPLREGIFAVIQARAEDPRAFLAAHFRAAAAPAPAPAAAEHLLPAEARSDAERRRAAEAYASAASLWAALRDGQAILLRATWLLRRAGFEEGEVEVEWTDYDAERDADGNYPKKTAKVPGWVARRAASALPHRAQIEADFPGAIMPVELCEAAHARLREVAAGAKDVFDRPASEAQRAQLDAAPVLVLSHCWEGPDHPDPEARTLRALAEALAGTWGTDWRGGPRPESGLPLYRAWGLADVGVFVDWASLYQDKPAGVRTAEQTECFKRALGNMSLW